MSSTSLVGFSTPPSSPLRELPNSNNSPSKKRPREEIPHQTATNTFNGMTFRDAVNFSPEKKIKITIGPGVTSTVTKIIKKIITDDFTYEGEINSQGLPHGKGIRKNTDGNIFEGEFVDGEFKSGKHHSSQTSALIYHGNFFNWKLSGEGKIYYSDSRLTVEGYFVEGLLEGKGKTYNAITKEVIYCGEFKESKYHGFGKLVDCGTYYDEESLKELGGGFVYEGQFTNGLIEGEGKLFAKAGRLVYEGAFKAEQFNGLGIRYYQDGSHCNGNFLNGLLDGKGKYFNVNNQLYYEGDFKLGKRHGQGNLFAANGNRYKGSFVDGTIHGYGTLHQSDGKIIFDGIFENNLPLKGDINFSDCSFDGEIRCPSNGEYINSKFFTGKGKDTRPHGDFLEYEGSYLQGCLHGEGIAQHKDGSVHEGEFKNDRLVKGTITMPNGKVFSILILGD